MRSYEAGKIRKERIGGNESGGNRKENQGKEVEVGIIASKVQERRLKWYGHVARRESTTCTTWEGGRWK